MGGDSVKALQLSLEDPPYQTRTDAVKVRGPTLFHKLLHSHATAHAAGDPPLSRAQNASFDVVCKAMRMIKEAEIESAVGRLSFEQCDVLMKYVYRGLGPAGKSNDNYTMLLKWHPVVLKRAGHSSIIRAISEVNQAL
jgi:actin related protein 2/3 complex subunit 5